MRSKQRKMQLRNSSKRKPAASASTTSTKFKHINNCKNANIDLLSLDLHPIVFFEVSNGLQKVKLYETDPKRKRCVYKLKKTNSGMSIFMAEFKTCYTLFLLILLICSGALALNPVSAQLFSNVQITIQISNSQSNYFVVNAYNMSGYLEASTQTHYPTASFELPKNQYIFTVTANNASAPSPVPLLGGSGSTSNGTASPLLPLYVAPAVEYGYAIEQVTGSTSLTIATKNVNQYPTNTLTVKVSYANGTAAQGAYVSASVMGSSYYWGYEPDVITWATSGSDGTATCGSHSSTST